MTWFTEADRIYAHDGDGRLVAEVAFPEEDNGIRDINRTFVDPSLRGQGIAGRLLAAACDEIERQGKKARPSCPYAVEWFQKHPERQGLLAD